MSGIISKIIKFNMAVGLSPTDCGVRLPARRAPTVLHIDPPRPLPDTSDDTTDATEQRARAAVISPFFHANPLS